MPASLRTKHSDHLAAGGRTPAREEAPLPAGTRPARGEANRLHRRIEWSNFAEACTRVPVPTPGPAPRTFFPWTAARHGPSPAHRSVGHMPYTRTRKERLMGWSFGQPLRYVPMPSRPLRLISRATHQRASRRRLFRSGSSIRPARWAGTPPRRVVPITWVRGTPARQQGRRGPLLAIAATDPPVAFGTMRRPHTVPNDIPSGIRHAPGAFGERAQGLCQERGGRHFREAKGCCDRIWRGGDGIL